MNRWGLWLFLSVALAACDDGESAAVDAGGGDGAAADAGRDLDPEPEPDASADAALEGRLVASMALVDFGLVAIGGEGQAELVLQNQGSAPVEITGFAGLAAPFSTRRSLPLTVPPGAERTVVLVFEPAAEGAASATVTVVAEGAGEPVVFELRGAGGRPTGELVAAVLDLGTVQPDEPASDFIEINNTGALPLTVLGVDGVEAPFAVPAGQVPTTAGEGQRARVLVQFSPGEDGRWTVPVTVRTDAGDFAVTLTGRAVTPGALVVVGVEPGFGPVDEAVAVVVHGGPFVAVPDAITVGGVALSELALIDEWRVGGRLGAANGEAPVFGPVDVRVESGGDFGLLPAAFIRTPPRADGATLEAPGAGPIEPAGNPWRLGFAAIGADETLVIAPGSVVLLDGDLTIDGALEVGGPEARTVLAGGGLSFTAAESSSGRLQNTAIEGAAGAGLAIDNPRVTATGIAVREAGGPCVTVGRAGGLVLVDAALTGCGGDAIQLAPTGFINRLQDTRIRRADWPVSGFAGNFGRLPIGAGHDWRGNAHDAIGIGGGLEGTVTLANQPAGVRYRVREALTVPRGATLRLNAGAPWVLDGPIGVDGRLELAGPTRIEAAAGGVVTVRAGGALSVAGRAGGPLVIEARAVDGEPQPGAWGGIDVLANGQFVGGHLTLRDGGADGPALLLGDEFAAFEGLVIEDALDVGLEISGAGNLVGARFAGNPGGVVITAGAGAISGISTDPAPAVRIADPAVCAAWDTTELLDGMGIAATVECAGGEGER